MRRRRLKFKLDQTLDESDMLVAKKEELAEELRTIEQEIGSFKADNWDFILGSFDEENEDGSFLR